MTNGIMVITNDYTNKPKRNIYRGSEVYTKKRISTTGHNTTLTFMTYVKTKSVRHSNRLTINRKDRPKLSAIYSNM